MNRGQNYRKGEQVWVEIPVEGGQNKVRPAEVISALNNSRLFGGKVHSLVRYLDKEGVGTYECIPIDRIIESP